MKLITAIPAETPVTVPVVPTVAIVALLLDHVPKGIISIRFVVEPVQTDNVPEMGGGGAGTVLTVTGLVA